MTFATTADKARAAAPTRLKIVSFAASLELQEWLEGMQAENEHIGDTAMSVLEHVMRDDKAHKDGEPMQ